MSVSISKEDNGKKGRFVLEVDGQFAGEMTFTWAGPSKMIIDHTGVEEAFGGKGYGKELVLAAIDLAKDQNLKILPLCPFAKKVFDKHPEWSEWRFGI